ncbi:MAG: glycosyltransferase [Gammaproteobacteria bacterium]|nr:MAG: glycosyltransferase [Gammaproteobacteria bacterium]
MDLNSNVSDMQVCFVLPTYNEEGNIKEIIQDILAVEVDLEGPVFSILVVDDNSKDRTQEIVRGIILDNNSVSLLTGAKQGLGDAYKRGITFALDNLNPDIIFQMDSDGQHDAALIPHFLEELNTGKDIVIGSRFIEGGETPDFSKRRLLISRIGNFMVRYVGGVSHLRDCTSGFRAIRASFLENCDFNFLSTKGYSFQSSLICDLVWRGAVASEIPIIFNSRKDGDSKLSFEDQLEFLFNIPRLGFRNMEDFIKYSIVGLSGVVLNLGIYTLLTRYFEFSELLAPIISIESALISNFMLNNIWTFGKRSSASRIRVKFLKFHLVSGFAAIINYLVFLVLLLSFGVYDILANFIGIALGAVVNYLINSNWTWKNSK